MGLIADTTLLIAAERGKFDLSAFFAAMGDEPDRIAAITASELLHGVERADTPERREKRSRYVEGVLSLLPVVEFDLIIARRHAVLWAGLEKAGKLIGPHDLLIAATALAGNDRAATLNVEEFSHVPDLPFVDVTPFRIS